MKLFNPNSPQDLSLLFFGGLLPIKVVQDMGFCKNGKPKTKKVKTHKLIKGLGLKPLDSWKTKKQGIYSVDEGTLKLIQKGIGPAAEIANAMLEIRGLKKLLSTYFESLKRLVYPDSCVHQQYQHADTDTSRLSCKNPNVQNQSAGKALEHFVSRYENGVLLSADYKSLEPRCEAQLSQDPNYIRDVINNVDPHTKNLSLQLHLSYEETEKRVQSGELKDARKKIKQFTFSFQYGGGIKRIMINSGLKEHEVIAIKEAHKEAYSKLHMYYQWLKDTVNKQGYYTDPWGRQYGFRKYPAKFHWQKGDSYLPTEIQNYRTQGFATGVLVLTMIGIFWRKKALHSRNKYVMINTIHDSLMLDVKNEFTEDSKKDLMILEDVGKISYEEFNYKFLVPIEIDISEGKTWSEL